MRHNSVIINAIPLLSKFTGIAKYTYEISKRILQFDRHIDATFYYGYFRKKLYFSNSVDISNEEKVAKKLKNVLAKIYFIKKIARQGVLFSSRFMNKECDLYWGAEHCPY